MKIVVALGGNALSRRGQKITIDEQHRNIAGAVRSLLKLYAAGHQLIITHGNGPQIGLIAMQAEAGPSDGHYPLDVLGAESEGMIGYLIAQEVRNQLGPSVHILTVLTQSLVDPHDAAFTTPSKPIGPQYDEARARKLSAERGWSVGPDGRFWRRVVASPRPLKIIESDAISKLVDLGMIVICAGGGGIPVCRSVDGLLMGVEAVVDKDLASAVLAEELGADFLLLLTDVDGVYLDISAEVPRRLATITPANVDIQQFPAGSMRPKVEAALQFATRRQATAAIGCLEQADLIVQGQAGTSVTA